MAGFSSGDGKEAEGVGVEAVELAEEAEAGDERLSSGERLRGVLVGELRDEAAEASRVR